MVYKIVGISAAAVILLIALVVGLVKGYTKTKTWATEYIFAVILSVLIYSLADLSGMNAWWAFALKVGTAVAFILLFALLSSRGKALLKKAIASAQKRSYYEQYGDREENVMQILDAIETGDAKAYKRLTKRKFTESRGGAGVADRICGGITLMIKVVVVFGLIALFAFFVLDLTQLPFVEKTFGGFYESGVWKFFSKFVMDALVIGVMFIAIRCGFRSGVVSVLWVLAVLGMIGGSVYLSIWLCKSVDAFVSAGSSLSQGALSGIANSISEYAGKVGLNITPEFVGQMTLAAAMSVVLIIISIIIGAVVGGIISRAREGAAFSTVDGVFGAVIAFAIACGIMLFVGAVLYTINDVSIMSGFNEYMTYVNSAGETRNAAIASVFYAENPLNSLAFIQKLPVRGWFA